MEKKSGGYSPDEYCYALFDEIVQLEARVRTFAQFADKRTVIHPHEGQRQQIRSRFRHLSALHHHFEIVSEQLFELLRVTQRLIVYLFRQVAALFVGDGDQFAVPVHEAMIGAADEQQIFMQIQGELLLKQSGHFFCIMKSVEGCLQKLLLVAEMTEYRYFVHSGMGGDFPGRCSVIAFLRHEINGSQQNFVSSALMIVQMASHLECKYLLTSILYEIFDLLSTAFKNLMSVRLHDQDEHRKSSANIEPDRIFPATRNELSHRIHLVTFPVTFMHE